MRLELRFPELHIPAVAERYTNVREDQVVEKLVPRVRKRGCLTRRELHIVARWKAPRSAGRIQSNSDSYVREITRFALRTREERARIEALTLLDGVSWPTASVLLHFFHHDVYPILDVRALWSIKLTPPSQYTFLFWWPFVEYFRQLMERTGADARVLDKALWQYSKEQQGRLG